MHTAKLDAAKRLARLHKEAEPNLVKAFLLLTEDEDRKNEPVKLLEIVDGAVEAGVMPIFFQPDQINGISFPSVIVELSPREFEQIEGAKRLPGEAWEIGQELAL